MSFDPHTPYNDLSLLPPNADLETKAVLRKAITANKALAELKGLGETIPNQSMLINTITLQEAQFSSEIENIITTTDALFKAFSAQTGQIDPATKEVLRYREALWQGYQALNQRAVLTTNTFIQIVQTIKKNEAGIRNTPGTKIINDRSGEVIYTPPEGTNVIREKLKNLEEYIHSPNNIDPLIKLAVIHYQFEAIHPFSDGNGRTGRILCLLYLIQQDLLKLPVLYLSHYIINRKSNYYGLLRSVTEQNQWEPWVLFMLEAVEKTAIRTKQKIIAIRELMENTRVEAKEKLPGRVYSKELIEVLFQQPYTKGRFLVNAGIAKRQAAAKYLKECERVGILRVYKMGKENLYLNTRLYQLLSK
jgi:Fic family protein